MRDDHLFWARDLFQVLEGNLAAAKGIVEEIPAGQFSSLADEEIVRHVFSKLEIMPIEIYEGEMDMEHSETKVDVSHDPMRTIFRGDEPFYVPGLRVVISVPYSGESELWSCKPSTYTFSPPRAKVHQSSRGQYDGHIEIVLAEPSDTVGDGTKIKSGIDKTITDIKLWLGYIRADVQAHNGRLRERIQQQVRHRRERLVAHGAVLKALNIPLKKKESAPDVSALPLRKRIIRPLPPASKGPPELSVRDEDYEYILKVIRHEGRSFEATPAAFAKHDEEELRDIILAHLNGHFEGQATGETFRKKGKTDIRIEYENRAAFVAECKVWRGAKQACEAVDQLLGYLTWKDCKTALVLFNAAVAGFAELQTKLPDVLRIHPRFLSELKTDQPGEWRFRVKSEDDEARHVTVHVFLFNLFVKRP